MHFALFEIVVYLYVDQRKEVLGDDSTLGSRMRNKYRIVCQISLRENWTKEQFITQIKQATNEMIKNEIDKTNEGKNDV